MPRRTVRFEPGAYYHLYNRGVNRQDIFFDQRNYSYFISRIENYILPVMDVIAYCLMPNHYHLIICVKDTSEVLKTSEVSKAMMKLSVSYTKAINNAYDRVGPIFSGAFQAKLVGSDAYLSQLIGYIHLNPVESGLVNDPLDWPHSSYRLQVDLGGRGNLGGPEPLPGL